MIKGLQIIKDEKNRFDDPAMQRRVEKAKALLSHTVEELYGISEPTMDRYNAAKAMDESTKAAAKAKAQAMREASKELDRFHKKAYNYIQARKLVKQLEYYTHWETIFESESAPQRLKIDNRKQYTKAKDFDQTAKVLFIPICIYESR